MMRRTGFLVIAAFVGAGVVVVASSAIANSHRRSGEPDAEENEAVRAAPYSSTGSCGVERWSVKTGTDADADVINLQSTTSTTIAALDAVEVPSTLPSNNRIQPTETTVFRVSATLTQYKLEADSDYHLVLSDGAGHTMISEIPDAVCVGSSSPLRTRIQTARSEFDAKYTATGSFQTANVPVTVTGVGFFDYQHGQTGVAPNGIELHAVLDIQFGTAPPPTCSGQLLGNPGFETGSAAPWSASSGVVSNNASEPPHSGSWDGWLDGYGNTHTDTLAQAAGLPAGCGSYTLTFWMHIDTDETTTATKYDTLKLQLLNSSGTVLSTLYTYSNLNHNTGYSRHTFNLAAYAGQTVTIKFTGTEDNTLQTSFVLDDTALTIT